MTKTKNFKTVDVVLGTGFTPCKWTTILHSSCVTSLGKPLSGDFYPTGKITQGDAIYSNRNIQMSLLYGAGVDQSGDERLPSADDKNLPWLYHGMMWYKGCGWYEDDEWHDGDHWCDAQFWYDRAEMLAERESKDKFERPVARLGADYPEREIPSYDLREPRKFTYDDFLKLKVKDVKVDPYDVDDGADYEKGSYYSTLKSAVKHIRAYFKEDGQRLPREQLKAELKGAKMDKIEKQHLLAVSNPSTVYADLSTEEGLPPRNPKPITKIEVAEIMRERQADEIFSQLTHSWIPLSELAGCLKTNARRQLREALVARGAVAERVLIGKTRIWCVKLP